MGETANAALFAIVYAKGLVGRDRLQAALDKATLEGLPLENVLLQGGILGRPQCEELLRVRNRLGRLCSACGGTTFLLQDETEATAACEFCGGKLLPPRTSAPPTARPTGPQPPTSATPQQRRASTATPAVQRPKTDPRSASGRLERLSAAAAGAAPPAPVTPPLAQGAPASAEALAERITQHVLGVVETRLAQEDLVGFLNTVVQKATQQAVETMSARLDSLAREAAKRALGELESRLEALRPPLARQVLEQVQAGIQLPDPARLQAAAEKAAEKAAERVAEKAAEKAAERVAEKAADHTARRAVAQAMSEHDLEALPARITEQVLEQVQDHLARHDLGGLRDQVKSLSASASDVGRVDEDQVEQLVRKLVEERLQALPARGGGGEALGSDEVEELAQRQARMVAREVVAEALQNGGGAAAIDPGALRAQTTEAVEEAMAGLRERLDELEQRPAGGAGEEELASLEARLQELENQPAATNSGVATELDPDLLKRIKDEVLQAVFVQDSPPASDVSRLDPLQLGAQVFDAVREQIQARLDFMAEQATGPVLKNIEKKVADLGLKTLPQRIKAEVLESIESSGGAIGPSGGGGGGDAEAIQKRVMNALETRLAEFDMAVESAIQETTSRAMEAVERRLSQLEEQSGERAVIPSAPSGPAQVPADVIEELLERARQAARQAVAERPSHLESSSGPDPRELLEQARATALDAIEERLKNLPAAAPAADERSGGPQTGVYDRKFIALAREVKQLKESLDKGTYAPTGASGASSGGGGGDHERQIRAFLDSNEFKELLESRVEARVRQLAPPAVSVGTTSAASGPAPAAPDMVALLGTVEFKQMFDTKINEVLKYLRNDLIPSAVKKTLREVEQKS